MTTEEKIDKVLEDADMDCEGANYHNLCGVAPKIYAAIEPFLKPNTKLSAAKAIADGVVSAF